MPSMLVYYGGVPVILAMLSAMVLIGLPMLLLEMSMARLANVGPSKLFGQMVPAFKILGLLMLLAALFTLSYHSMVLVWAMQLFVQSFQQPFPWTHPVNITYCLYDPDTW